MNTAQREVSGRGRGRGKPNTNGAPSFSPWSTRGPVNNANRDQARNGKPPSNFTAKQFTKRANDANWKTRETASEERLEKAKEIQQKAAENFSHLLEDSDSDNEELRDEEIIRKAVKSYEDQFEGDLNL